jgi:hypothetical protein
VVEAESKIENTVNDNSDLAIQAASNIVNQFLTNKLNKLENENKEVW